MSAETLLISLQGVGNNILALPLADAIARSDGKPVDFLARSPRVAPLLKAKASVADVLYPGDPTVNGFAGLVRRIRRGRYRRAVVAHPAGRSSILLAAMAFIPDRIGLTHGGTSPADRLLTRKAKSVDGLHDVEQNAQIAQLAGCEINFTHDWPPLNPSLGNLDGARVFIKERGFNPEGRFLGFHTGCDGNFLEKRWPEEYFAALAQEVYRTMRLPAICFDGPAEPGAGRRIARIAKSPVLAMDGWGGLLEALGMMFFCDLFVSGDSGLMNLAAAAGVPTLGLFGPSQAWRTRPFGDLGRFLKADRPCVPCYDIGRFRGCLHPDHPCMSDIAPQDAARAVMEIIRG